MIKTIRTVSGKEFDVLWEGVSFNSVLHIAVVNSDMDTIHQTFKNSAETSSLTRIEDGIESVYTGFTGYRGFDLKPDGEIVVALNPEV